MDLIRQTCVFPILALLALALTACGMEQGADQAAADTATDSSAASQGRDIPLTEIVLAENERDLRLIAALRSYIPTLMRSFGTPGLNIALARRGETVWEAGFGYADLANRKPMTPETAFRSGSMGKLYTGMAIMKLVEDGALELDGPINSYLPFEVRNPLGGRDITVRDLLTHRPGLMSDAALSLFRTPAPLRESIEAEFQREMTPIAGGDSVPRWAAKAGEKFMYSNLGMGTLGLIVEENNPEGLSYSEFVEKYFMQPLGMRYSQYPPVQDQEQIRPEIWQRLSVGYMPMGSLWMPTPAVYFGNFPAGGFVSIPGDFVRFLLCFMNGGELDGVRILKPETVELALSPQGEAFPDMPMGLAWLLRDLDKPTFSIQHNGAHMFGWHNASVAWPNFDTAVVYAANHWALPELAPDITLLQDFIKSWLQHDRRDLQERRSGPEWAKKVSYVRGALFVAGFNYAIAIPTPVSDEQIMQAADGAILNPDFAATQSNWDRDAFVQGAQDMRAKGSTAAALSAFLDDNPAISREDFSQAYAELGGNSQGSMFFGPFFKTEEEAEEASPRPSSA